MFKKLALVMACAISAAMFFTGCSEESSSGSSSSSSSGSSSSSSSKIDQSSIKGVTKTLINALINKDEDTLWAILAPDLKKEAIEKYDSEAKAKEDTCKLFFALISDQSIADNMKKVMREDEEGAINRFIDGCGGEDSYEEIDGKWYYKGNSNN